jgi:hypothetical protein
VTQPNQSTLARKWTLEVNTNGTPANFAAPTWTTVKGLSDFTPDNLKPELKDDNVYEDSGWGGQTKTMLAWQVKAKIMRRTVPTDVTSYDAGQEKLRALARVFGPSGVGDFRWYDRDGGAEAFRGWANVTWTNDGGSTDDLETVSITLDGKGPNTIITNPNAVAGSAPIVTSIAPATVAAASTAGFLVIVKGDYFTGTVSAVIGATAITQFNVIDRFTLAVSLPAKTAGTYDIRVTNAVGQSAITGADAFVVT